MEATQEVETLCERILRYDTAEIMKRPKQERRLIADTLALKDIVKYIAAGRSSGRLPPDNHVRYGLRVVAELADFDPMVLTNVSRLAQVYNRELSKCGKEDQLITNVVLFRDGEVYGSHNVSEDMSYWRG